MESCSDTCPRLSAADAPEITAQIEAAAETLAGLLTERPEFQNFLRLASAVRLDEEVAEIMALMNAYPGPDIDNNEQSEEALEARLESLPVVRSYRIAEQSARGIFSAIEQVISEAAGVAFAENAKPSACG